MAAATSYYACVWCKVHKDNRWKTPFPLDHYESSILKRTIKEISEMAKKKGKETYCCEHTPLLIELHHVIRDELHLLLRILDVLIENLIRDVLQWDQKENRNKKKVQQKNTHLTNLQVTIRSCGILFDTWEKTNAGGKGSGQYDFTSLLGSDKKTLLRELPTKLNGVIQADTIEVIKNL